MLVETVGDITRSETQYICHQCNSVTNRASHLAKIMFNVFPWANIYAERGEERHKPADNELPGNIIIRGDGKTQRFVINMIGQYYPGMPKYLDSIVDGIHARQSAFADCLEKIVKIEGLKTISFPHGIGCGAAGGQWKIYRMMIENFSLKNPEVDVVIVRFEG